MGRRDGQVREGVRVNYLMFCFNVVILVTGKKRIKEKSLKDFD